MALIKCPECGKEFSSFAKACPNCGFPIEMLNKNRDILNIEFGDSTSSIEFDSIKKEVTIWDSDNGSRTFNSDLIVSIDYKPYIKKERIDNSKLRQQEQQEYNRNNFKAALLGAVMGVGIIFDGSSEPMLTPDLVYSYVDNWIIVFALNNNKTIELDIATKKVVLTDNSLKTINNVELFCEKIMESCNRTTVVENSKVKRNSNIIFEHFIQNLYFDTDGCMTDEKKAKVLFASKNPSFDEIEKEIEEVYKNIPNLQKIFDREPNLIQDDRITISLKGHPNYYLEWGTWDGFIINKSRGNYLVYNKRENEVPKEYIIKCFKYFFENEKFWFDKDWE